MSAKSWLITALPILVGVGLTLVTFVTGVDVNPTHTQLLDYLLVLGLGSGAIGSANAGYKKYVDYKKQ